MGKRGFSATTVVLVAVLLGALFMVSKSVTPPPAAPPAPPKEQAALPPATVAQATKTRMDAMKGLQHEPTSMMQRKKTEMMDMMKHHVKLPSKPTFNANAIEVTSDYWHQAQPGSQGEAIMRDKVAKAKAEEAMKKVSISPVQPPPPGPPKGMPQRQMGAPSASPGAGSPLSGTAN